ncbi:MAG: hypothetical protein WD651_14755 [Acidimicrobiia bacterium]
MRHNLAPALVWGSLLTVAVTVGGVFGDASASGRQRTAATIEVDLRVEVGDAETVVAHVIEPGADQTTVPLVHLDGDVYGIIIELRKADHLVVFEALIDGVSSQSQPFHLTDLGLDPALIGVVSVTPTTAPEISSETRLWGWAGLGLTALALAFLAWWALPDRTAPEATAEPPEEAPEDAGVDEPL